MTYYGTSHTNAHKHVYVAVMNKRLGTRDVA
jgi:hypothetical protein